VVRCQGAITPTVALADQRKSAEACVEQEGNSITFGRQIKHIRNRHTLTQHLRTTADVAIVIHHRRPPRLPAIPMHAVWPHRHAGFVFPAQRLLRERVINKAVDADRQRPARASPHDERSVHPPRKCGGCGGLRAHPIRGIQGHRRSTPFPAGLSQRGSRHGVHHDVARPSRFPLRGGRNRRALGGVQFPGRAFLYRGGRADRGGAGSDERDSRPTTHEGR
jgi:hypothetical protein